jgi:CheY-like chemotaxis protein
MTKQTLHILLVEDEPVQLEIYRQKLASWNIPLQLVTADNGINALLKQGQTPPDLVITDLDMPVMDGFQMMRMLQQSSSLQSSHFIVITALPLDQVQQQGNFPADVTLMAKPVDFGLLEKIIRERLNSLSR